MENVAIYLRKSRGENAKEALDALCNNPNEAAVNKILKKVIKKNYVEYRK